MTLKELEEKTKYYAADLLLDGCLNRYEEIDTDKALKKIISNDFTCGICDWLDGVELKDVPKIFVSSDGESSKEDLKNLIKLVELIAEKAKEEKSEIYMQYSKIFDQLLAECKEYSIVSKGKNEYFSIEIFKGIDLISSIQKKYRKQWK
jgi:hypothetical protein